MPLCTGSIDKTDLWTCPYCPPKDKSDVCHKFVTAEDGQTYKISCTSVSCTRVGFKSDDNDRYWAHMVSAHGWPHLPTEMNPAYLRLQDAPAVMPEAFLAKPSPALVRPMNRKDRRRQGR